MFFFQFNIFAFLTTLLLIQLTTPAWALDRYIPVILDKIPRNSQTFTQGIKFHRGDIFESAGLYGQSGLYHHQLVDKRPEGVSSSNILSYSRPLGEFKFPADAFAEDIEIVGSLIYLLTWKKESLYIFNIELDLVDKKKYLGEGWGIAFDGRDFITSDGSSKLTFRDRKNFTPIRSIEVVFEGQELSKVNALEYVRGSIYANVWFDNHIYIISPETGQVEGVVNCEILVRDNLRSATTKNEGKGFTFSQLRENVLNGIAHDPQENVFYLTGKRWNFFYKILLRKV